MLFLHHIGVEFLKLNVAEICKLVFYRSEI